jgi:hypothetical protein
MRSARLKSAEIDARRHIAKLSTLDAQAARRKHLKCSAMRPALGRLYVGASM